MRGQNRKAILAVQSHIKSHFWRSQKCWILPQTDPPKIPPKVTFVTFGGPVYEAKKASDVAPFLTSLSWTLFDPKLTKMPKI